MLELYNEVVEVVYLSKDYDIMDCFLKIGFSSVVGEFDKVKFILV